MDTIPAYYYLILSLLLTAALASLGYGLRNYWLRIKHGKPFFGDSPNVESIKQKFNLATFISRGLMTSRLKKRPVAGSFHGIMFIGALLLIFGHAAYMLSFIGVPIYDGWFGTIFMKLGRELGGIMLFIGVLFFLLRRLVPPERLTNAKDRKGFERGEIILLVLHPVNTSPILAR